MSYVRTAADALALCAAKDPYLPKPSEAIVLAWAEDLELYRIDRESALEAVRTMYRQHGDPGFRPTIKMLCDIARQVRARNTPALPPSGDKITLAEWEARHGEKFPRFAIGKAVADE